MSKLNLFVCGSSVAAGWGTGKVEKTDPLDSWPHWLATGLNADTFYNYSMPMRTNGSVILETLEFIKEYEEEGHDLDDVMLVMEFLHPMFLDVGTVKTKTGTTASVSYKPDTLRKTGDKEVYLNFKRGSLDKWKVSTTVDLTILLDDEYKELMIRLDNAKDTMLNDYNSIVMDLHRKLGNFVTYLRSRKIKYLMTWVLTDSVTTEKIVYDRDRSLYEHCYDKRFIKSTDFSTHAYCFDTNSDSLSELGHPTMEGHRKLANFLSTYIEDNRLLDAYEDTPIIIG